MPRHPRTARPARAHLLTLTLGLVAIASLGALAACTSTAPRLAPASSANLVDDDTVQEEAAGVTLTTQVGRWEGDSGVLEQLTPVWISIENASHEPLDLRYEHFSLVAPDGTGLTALPIELLPSNTDVRVENPRFDYDDFYVYDSMSAIYPGLPVADDQVYIHQHGHDFTPVAWGGDASPASPVFADWMEASMPTADILSMAVPEGVIEPGGRISGYIFFEDIEDTEREADDEFARIANERAATWDDLGIEPVVWLHTDLVNARTNRSFGLITMPFLVD